MDPLPELPPAAKDVHVHASTPCTALSSAKQSATQADVSNGVAMLRWALDLFLERGDHSWSIENVSTPTTRKVLEEYRTRFPDRVAFATLCASDFGACQTRIRLIAAPTPDQAATRDAGCQAALCAGGLCAARPRRPSAVLQKSDDGPRRSAMCEERRTAKPHGLCVPPTDVVVE